MTCMITGTLCDGKRETSETLVWCMQEIIEQNMQAPKGSAKNKLKRKELRA